MKVRIRFVFLIMVSIGAFTAQAALAPARGSEQVRSQLSSYFKNIATNSPTVLGGLAKSPEAMAAIQKRIGSMSEAELGQFQKLMAETPDWKVAPEAFAGAFPPEMLDQIRRVGADYAQQVPKGEKMRDDVRALVGVLKLLPDAKLKELAIDRKMIDSLEATFTEMTPLQAAMLQKQAGQSGAWHEKSAMAMHALPPALQRGAAALAEHGPLTGKDLAELEEFRVEMMELLGRIDRLSPEMRKTLKAEGLSEQVRQLGAAPPDVLFMVRHNMPQEMLRSLRQNVAFLERVSRFTDEEKKDLERFRSDLGRAFRQVKPEGASEDWHGADEMLAGLGPEHLFILQKQMEGYGSWQVALPVVYQTLASSELPARMQAVRGSTADPAALRSLEDFRQQALRYIDAVGPTSGLDAALVARARQTIENVPPDRLELIRMATERMPPQASAKDRLSVVLMHEINFGCSFSITAVPEVCFPEICVGGCVDVAGVEVCTPRVCTPAGCTPAVTVTADFNSVCDPIENALETVEHSIVGIANSIVETMRAGIQATITGVENTINAAINGVTHLVNTSVAAITDTVNSVWTFLQTLPDLAWTAIKSALNLLLDIQIRNGVTVRDLVGRGVEHALTSMRTLLGMAGDWWTAISNFTLPLIPCPPTGFHTPFGDVGDGAAVDNYGRYRLVIDGIIGMIPDTETSLAIKIPAQVLYMAYDFLGLCLEQAAANADNALAGTRHDLVITNFANMQAYVGAQIAGLTLATGNSTTEILNLINTQASNIQMTVMNQSTAIQNVTNNQSTAIQNLVNNESTSIQTLLQNESDATQDDVEKFRNLYLRLTIERVLADGNSAEIAHFQLLEPWGYLKLASEIVKETMQSMVVAQEGIGNAQKFYDRGVTLMNTGKYKDAFKEFIQAYHEATKGNGN